MYKNFLKRLIDVTVATVVLLLLSPLFISVMIVLYIANSGSPFFVQVRPGKNEKLFKILKFKTMNDKRNVHGELLPDLQRLTPIGIFVRKTSLDELPQLLNVIKGDMSLIGPRPLLPQYLPFYSEAEKLRHSVRPGITGWAQVNGRNLTEWPVRLMEDVFYIKNLSFSLDIRIVITTIKNVLSAKDIVVDPTSLMEPLDVERKNKRVNLFEREHWISEGQVNLNANNL